MQMITKNIQASKDLKNQLDSLSKNFDQASYISAVSRQVLDESLIKGFSTQLKVLDKLGVSQTKKVVQRKELRQLLEDTSSMSSVMSNMKFKRFKEEMLQRKQTLAFKMQKIYFLKRHSRKVYEQLSKRPKFEREVDFKVDDSDAFLINQELLSSSVK